MLLFTKIWPYNSEDTTISLTNIKLTNSQVSLFKLESIVSEDESMVIGVELNNLEIRGNKVLNSNSMVEVSDIREKQLRIRMENLTFEGNVITPSGSFFRLTHKSDAFTLRQCKIESNQGLFMLLQPCGVYEPNLSQQVHISDCVFSSNRHSTMTSLFYVTSYSEVTVSDSVFSDNFS